MKLHRHETLEAADFVLSEMFRLNSKARFPKIRIWKLL